MDRRGNAGELEAQPNLSRRCARQIAAALLAWFSEQGRDLPWRRTRDPYPIWISEVMLQQTQVETVIPFWERWMKELPSIARLAAADEQEILKLWEGLGYYTRARNLRRAAQLIVAHHAGRFPTCFDQVIALPGIGRYTAGAICSIAFNQPTPILDGNVIRVLARRFAIRGNPREPRTNRALWQLAETLVRTAANEEGGQGWSASHFNQGLMELGATICSPRNPRCEVCPLRNGCVARRKDLIAELPNLPCRAAPTRRRFVSLVIRHEDRFLIRQRARDEVNGSLWEFPNIEVPFKTGTRPGWTVADLFSGSLAALAPLCEIQHRITRYDIRLEVFLGTTLARPAGQAGEWRSLPDLDQLPFPSAHRRIVRTLRESEPSRGRQPRRE